MEQLPIAEAVDEGDLNVLPASVALLSDQDRTALTAAVVDLEYPGLVARASDVLATPIEFGLKVLPARARDTVTAACRSAIEKALDVSLWTMDTSFVAEDKPQASSDWWHMGAVAVTGTVGGFVGFASLPVELPLSTIIILRSIADIARSEGEDLDTAEARLECVAVFSLGGSSDRDDDAEIGYFFAREAMASMISRTTAYYEAQVAKQVAEKVAKAAAAGAAKAAAKAALQEATAVANKVQSTALVKFTEAVASRYSVVVTESAMAKAGPIIGAALGGIVNSLFISHFQAVARAHFTVRRLEREHGQASVQAAYASIAEEVKRERRMQKHAE
ncbi:MAG TPA: peptidase [Stenotrophomonas sp.]|nr:peptidase [Stenotrophomonas sp.]